ncbi:MAG: hypothetical protein JPMHGGIA_00061 [Saprospiraceae bacterium]|jgi:N-acetylmuramoyl-L-alanine amidase|nr:hypothetical protein [Saprospiraceae bacterium]
MVNIRIAVTLFLCLAAGYVTAKSGPKPKTRPYVAEAGKGEGVYALLRRHHLLEDPNNVTLFFRLNKLRSGQSLVAGKKYQLPMDVSPYDGRSIRSSTGISDYDKAKRIERFNDSFRKSLGLRSELSREGKVYIPRSERVLKAWDQGAPPDLLVSNTHAETKVKSKKASARREELAKRPQDPDVDSRERYLIAGVGGSVSLMDPVAERRLRPEEIALAAPESITAGMSFGSARKVSTTLLDVPLFGDGYSRVELLNESLNNQVFYIVPGHGGPDPGAMAKNVDGHYTICEDEYAYDVSLRLARKLMEAGARVYVIVEDKNDGIRDETYLDCDTDEKLFGGHKIHSSQKKRLRQGISKVNGLFEKYRKKGFTKQWMVSIHIDAQSETNRQDVFFYYQSESADSKNKAVDIQKIFEEKYQVYRKSREYDGTVSARPLYVVRNSKPEPIFIELANIHNPEDRQRILVPRNRELLASWIAEGFMMP